MHIDPNKIQDGVGDEERWFFVKNLEDIDDQIIKPFRDKLLEVQGVSLYSHGVCVRGDKTYLLGVRISDHKDTKAFRGRVSLPNGRVQVNFANYMHILSIQILKNPPENSIKPSFLQWSKFSLSIITGEIYVESLNFTGLKSPLTKFLETLDQEGFYTSLSPDDTEDNPYLYLYPGTLQLEDVIIPEKKVIEKPEDFSNMEKDKIRNENKAPVEASSRYSFIRWTKFGTKDKVKETVQQILDKRANKPKELKDKKDKGELTSEEYNKAIQTLKQVTSLIEFDKNKRQPTWGQLQPTDWIIKYDRKTSQIKKLDQFQSVRNLTATSDFWENPVDQRKVDSIKQKDSMSYYNEEEQKVLIPLLMSVQELLEAWHERPDETGEIEALMKYLAEDFEDYQVYKESSKKNTQQDSLIKDFEKESGFDVVSVNPVRWEVSDSQTGAYCKIMVKDKTLDQMIKEANRIFKYY
jgi:hypothetical protein